MGNCPTDVALRRGSAAETVGVLGRTPNMELLLSRDSGEGPSYSACTSQLGKDIPVAQQRPCASSGVPASGVAGEALAVMRGLVRKN